ncbi:hypothetical protein ACFPOD_12335 [Nitratireductor kimnyeongensis]|uniref:Uncharacterized protein n=1 Tax=Nitratireductor kimnyeongensis TaxID=430679 RepID=A0ABW0T9A7_9HYPH|nr:hypothetical protein [Nitratireductor kimnyeongensis]QZZ35694.1 hypothetical protein KW403_00465 [Nitratireductor kimnyeongensis]
MNRTASAFLLVAVLTGSLVALGFALQIKGYGVGNLGNERLDGLASASSFVPLAALYALAAMLVTILPIRAAAMVHSSGTTPLYLAAIVLFATIVGVQGARLAFGNTEALRALLDWQFLFVAGIVAAHLSLDTLRRNVLLRTLAFIGFGLSTLACLYWTFRF